MTNLPRIFFQNVIAKLGIGSLAAATILAAFAAGSAASAQVTANRLADRIKGAIDNTSRAALAGSMPRRALHSTDLGSVAPDTKIQGITLAFSRTAAQQADLSSLIVAQQTPGSPQFHQWLTPAQFGARFGVSDNDLAATESWLQSQGFTIDSVSPSRESITFSGTAASVATAFGAPIHYFRSNSDTVTHYAPANDLTLPAALSNVVLAVANLSTYRPRAHMVKPAFTSAQSGSHFMTPGDVATIYDLKTAYNSGYNGQGQTIVVAGESQIQTADISNFQKAAGVAYNTPNTILVPNTGGSQVDPYQAGDEGESDLDVEYSSSIANKATIDFVFVGNDSNLGVFQSVIYAIQQDLGQIITISYGECEPDLGQYYINYYDSYFQQAAAQGQTVINSSGDSGSTACYGDGNTSPVNGIQYQEQVAVSYPASSPYVTGVGGTEFPTADVAAASPSTAATQYWSGAAAASTNTSSGVDTISSALSYIPEQAWNDDSSAAGLSSGGGGVSIFETRPSWQANVPGIPSGNYRLVPDVSFDAALVNAPYIFCTSDSADINTAGGQVGSCVNGFRDANNTDLTLAGGTSFAAPIFAGMLAIINQAKGYNNGQGLIGPTLYTLASNSTTYASAFHDVNVSGNGNNCTAGLTYCSGPALTDYPTGVGYDEATGLGSLDITKVIAAWPGNTTVSPGLAAAQLTATPGTMTPSVNAADTITINVTSKTGGTTPTGTVSVKDNGTAVSGSPFTLTNGAYSYSYSSASVGVHTLTFTYSGDATYGPTSNTEIINVGNTNFTITATSPTISTGSSGTVTVTVTPVGGYTGTVQLTLAGGYNSGNVAITNTCFTNTPYTIVIPAGTTAPVSASYTVYTSAATCATNGLPSFAQPGSKSAVKTRAAAEVPASPAQRRGVPVLPAAGLAGLLGLLTLGSFKRRSRLLRGGLSLGFVLMLGISALGISGCSSGASGNTSTTTTTTSNNTYYFAVFANDSVDLAISQQADFTVTLQ